LGLVKVRKSPNNSQKSRLTGLLFFFQRHVAGGKYTEPVTISSEKTPLHASERIASAYRALTQAYGPMQWWPAKTRFEVIVGAFLTQNTSWKNVALALKNLRRAGILSVSGIQRIALSDLEQLVRPSGYFRQKASRLKTFVRFLDDFHGGSLSAMFAKPTEQLRRELLSLNGVGPETADAILLYAGKLPVFVVDAYTRRIFERHQFSPNAAKYEDLRRQVETAFQILDNPSELAGHFNEFHALIVEVGKRHCGPVAKCEGCPLQPLLIEKQALPSRKLVHSALSGSRPMILQNAPIHHDE
jgi:endonuclease-3 related protein